MWWKIRNKIWQKKNIIGNFKDVILKHFKNILILYSFLISNNILFILKKKLIINI